VGPRAGLDSEVTGKVLSPLPGIEPLLLGRPARSQTLAQLISRCKKGKEIGERGTSHGPQQYDALSASFFY
jgi:hypothetical protein